jgi:hypothetical protein
VALSTAWTGLPTEGSGRSGGSGARVRHFDLYDGGKVGVRLRI